MACFSMKKGTNIKKCNLIPHKSQKSGYNKKKTCFFTRGQNLLPEWASYKNIYVRESEGIYIGVN